ncbi:UDP-glucose 4-epimerase family protein [Chromobacterium haemolyticum]|uniref:UDP-glucose 4-epimerase family protein n=1 Tax=Chromobacterium haemolyticum TaxID=394935 RepID=UPI000DEED76C|nr:SDR family oxidoreductase [Chromobacterium haemolyticum]
MRCLVTGSNGFVGRHLVSLLREKGSDVVSVVRTNKSNISNIDDVVVGEINGDTNWFPVLNKVDCVIHAAARVHQMNDTALDPLQEFCRVNTEGTLNLARQAAKNGVKRFIFISSIKVNGERTSHDGKFTADELGSPLDPYGISKAEAEAGLRVIAKENEMEVVIIRPPLVYGPGVKANFLALVKLIDKGIPLPFSKIDFNGRSLVSIQNLIDFISTCITHPRAANETFLVSDGCDLSTKELVLKLSRTLGKKAKLFPVPVFLLLFCAAVLGKKPLANRLIDSLRVDIEKNHEILNWSPPFTVDECFSKLINFK